MYDLNTLHRLNLRKKSAGQKRNARGQFVATGTPKRKRRKSKR